MAGTPVTHVSTGGKKEMKNLKKLKAQTLIKEKLVFLIKLPVTVTSSTISMRAISRW